MKSTHNNPPTGGSRKEVNNMEVLSPYALAKEAAVRPQMVYNYIRKGWIKASVGPTGKLQVTRADADAWLEKYRARKAETLARLQAELAGE